MTKGWKLESARHSLARKGIKTKGIEKDPQRMWNVRVMAHADAMQKAKLDPTTFVEPYYDNELEPPSWGTRIGHIEKQNGVPMLVIDDWIGADSKREAYAKVKKIRKEMGLKV